MKSISLGLWIVLFLSCYSSGLKAYENKRILSETLERKFDLPEFGNVKYMYHGNEEVVLRFKSFSQMMKIPIPNILIKKSIDFRSVELFESKDRTSLFMRLMCEKAEAGHGFYALKFGLNETKDKVVLHKRMDLC